MQAQPVVPLPDAKQAPTGGAIVLFVLAALGISALILLGQVVSWNLEQTAIADASLGSLANAGKIWFLTQASVIAVLCGIAVAVSKSTFRPVYRSWLIAALITLPAWSLRFLGPNDDQLGAVIQIGLCSVAAAVILLFDRRPLRLDRRIALALTFVPFGIWPFLVWGALGSGTDTMLNVLVGLAFGLLAASLIVKTDSNYFLNGLGTGILLAILGSAIGYDGGQLLLLVVLPSFGFILTYLASSLGATTLAVGLLAAAPLVFIDPTELTIVLGDLLPWALRASLLMTGLGLLMAILGWLLLRNDWRITDGGTHLANYPAFAPLAAWAIGVALYGFLGLHGFSGDRLFVIMKDQADLSQAASITDRNQRLTYVYKTLTHEATTSQADLRKTLERYGIHYTPYYLVNSMEVDGSALVRLYLQSRTDVDRIIPSPRLRPIPALGAGLQGDMTTVDQNPGWNIAMIGADRVWREFGVTGKGIVVGQSDTGVDIRHPALRDQYRGATTGSNDYNWYDPWDGSVAPHDVEGHGTHTLGIVLGKAGIGVAPDAQWMACVNLARNLGDPPFYLNCMQFMLAPFPRNGDPLKDGDPTRAAYVLNNSWGCPPIEGCDAEALKPAVDALTKAGIFVIVSAGNDGPSCDTLSDPPAIYASAFSVGAVDQSGNVAMFSSRGPVTVDGSGRIKPDISAPGVQVVSSLPGGTYGPLDGTSMAGPHVAGVVTLMWSANPALIGDIDRTEQILVQTARVYQGSRPAGECFTGGTPNNAYGYGIVDAYAAVKMALGK
ncbi:MAG TPA: S8 family serine peptidase [Anaerolineales bacterium]